MFPLDILIYFSLWVIVHNPIYLTNEYIDGLQVTPNPDTYLTPVETHYVRTVDGFILEIHRIPHGLKKGEGNQYPVLLVHGFLDSSFSWIANGPDGALAYLLADQGFDVWLMNIRGNTFSQSHAKYTPMEKEFWDFSFHEVGIYDLPATIDFILKKTRHEKLFCICLSAGSTEFFIMLSELPEFKNKVIAQASLAPYYHKLPPTILKLLAPIANPLLEYLYTNTRGDFLDRDLLTKLLVQISTTLQISGYSLFVVILQILLGWHFDHINWEILPTIYSNFPAGTSAKQTEHFFQLRDSFNNYDYGPEKNLEIYGMITAPPYNISNIDVPVKIYYGIEDSIGPDFKALQQLRELLPKVEGIFRVPDLGYSHLDFAFNKNARELVYDDVIAFVKNVTIEDTLG